MFSLLFCLDLTEILSPKISSLVIVEKKASNLCFSVKMKYYLLLLVVCAIYPSINAISFKLDDIGRSTVDVTFGVVEKVKDSIPTPSAIFQGGKNLIAGYPFEAVIPNNIQS